MYKRKAFRRYRKRTTKKVTKPKVSLAVKKYVKSSLHRQIENKLYEIQWSQALGGYANSNTLYAFPLTPYTGGLSISQGVTSSSRTGNQIKPRSLIWNFCLTNQSYNATTNPSPQPCIVEIFICSLKGEASAMPNSIDITSLFQLNNAAVPPTGSVYDLTQPVNKDYFICYKRMRFKVGFAISGGTGSVANLQSFSNNDFKLLVNHKANLFKHCPKTMVFPDASTTPTSRCLFALINVMPAIGNTAFAGTVQPLRLDSTIHFEYEDA